jgi:hypothetical protein
LPPLLPCLLLLCSLLPHTLSSSYFLGAPPPQTDSPGTHATLTGDK